MYDPLDEVTHVGNHRKNYTITKDGISLKQKIDWLVSNEATYSYLTMLPIIRGNDDASPTQITDTVFDNVTYDEYDISVSGFVTYPNVKKHGVNQYWLYSDVSGVSASVKCQFINDLPDSVSYVTGNVLYNKVYFSYCGETHNITSGDVWESEAQYILNIK
jgi:hypothetical protein